MITPKEYSDLMHERCKPVIKTDEEELEFRIDQMLKTGFTIFYFHNNYYDLPSEEIQEKVANKYRENGWIVNKVDHPIYDIGLSFVFP